MARTLHRDGASIVGLDVPQLSSELDAVMAELGGTSIAEDITAPDAPQVIAEGDQGRPRQASTSSCTTRASPATSASRT